MFCKRSYSIVIQHPSASWPGFSNCILLYLYFYLWCLTVQVSSERKDPADKCCLASESLQSWTRGKWLLWTVSTSFSFCPFFSFPWALFCWADWIRCLCQHCTFPCSGGFLMIQLSAARSGVNELMLPRSPVNPVHSQPRNWKWLWFLYLFFKFISFFSGLWL